MTSLTASLLNCVFSTDLYCDVTPQENFRFLGLVMVFDTIHHTTRHLKLYKRDLYK